MLRMKLGEQLGVDLWVVSGVGSLPPPLSQNSATPRQCISTVSPRRPFHAVEVVPTPPHGPAQLVVQPVSQGWILEDSAIVWVVGRGSAVDLKQNSWRIHRKWVSTTCDFYLFPNMMIQLEIISLFIAAKQVSLCIFTYCFYMNDHTIDTCTSWVAHGMTGRCRQDGGSHIIRVSHVRSIVSHEL